MSQTRGTGSGPHLLLYQGHGCRSSHLSDFDLLYHLLEDLPDRICSTRILRHPHVFRHTDGEEWYLLDRSSQVPRVVTGTGISVEEERRHVATALGLEASR